jgi:hypothetical protein
MKKYWKAILAAAFVGAMTVIDGTAGAGGDSRP